MEKDLRVELFVAEIESLGRSLLPPRLHPHPGDHGGLGSSGGGGGGRRFGRSGDGLLRLLPAATGKDEGDAQEPEQKGRGEGLPLSGKPRQGRRFSFSIDHGGLPWP